MRFSKIALLTLVVAITRADQTGAFTSNGQPSFNAMSTERSTIFHRGRVILQSSESPDMNDESHIQQAYRDWCAKYAKSPDPVRYQSFKNNYITITVHNVKTKEEAERAGKPTPKWITLNQYGDYSVAEYEQFMKGGPSAPSPAPAPAPAPQLTKPAEISATPTTGNSNQVVEAAVQLQQSIGALGKGALTASSFNLLPAVREGYNECRQAYKDWCSEYGKKEEPLRFATFASNYFALKQYAAQTGDTLKMNQYADCTKDEVARMMNNAASDNQSSVVGERQTQAVPEIQTGSQTQAVAGPSPSQDSAPAAPRQGISALGTGYNPGGSSSTDAPAKSYNPFNSKPSDSKAEGTVMVDRAAGVGSGMETPSRGTVVIKRQVSDPPKDTYSLGSFFDRENTDSSPSGGSQGVPQASADNNASGTEQERDLTSSVMSFFGGVRKTALDYGTRKVQGTIQIPTYGDIESSERATIHIQNRDENGFFPSIVSFFGGAKKPSNKRPTIVIKAQGYWNQFMNFVEDRDRKAAIQEAEYIAYVNAKHRSTRSVESQSSTVVPVVREWKQNLDGSITGYIYNSNFYQDGTQLTTSPVPYEATGNSVVETVSGSRYSLMD